MSLSPLRHEFVEHMPERLEDGVLYVSVPFRTVLHSCACGCGAEVVTPLGPAEWSFTYDGETISIAPSVGNWSLACRSHYVIDRSRVRWARNYSQTEVDEVRAGNRLRRQRYFARRQEETGGTPRKSARHRPLRHFLRRLLPWRRRSD